MMTSRYFLSKSYLDVVLVGVEAAAMIVSVLLQLGQVSLRLSACRKHRDSLLGGRAARHNDGLAGVDGTGATTI